MTDKVEYRLGFGSEINEATANNLRNGICLLLSKEDFGSLTIMFSSDGGCTDQSLSPFQFHHSTARSRANACSRPRRKCFNSDLPCWEH